jgi:hypothetical protein
LIDINFGWRKLGYLRDRMDLALSQGLAGNHRRLLTWARYSALAPYIPGPAADPRGESKEVAVTVFRKTGVPVWALGLFAALAAGLPSSDAAAQDVISFKEDVFPIIEVRCLECHQPGGIGYETSGLDMRSYDALMEGTKYGSVVTPGSAVESNILAVIDQRTDPEIWMPHNKKKLTKCERLTFRFWVMQGAKNN